MNTLERPDTWTKNRLRIVTDTSISVRFTPQTKEEATIKKNPEDNTLFVIPAFSFGPRARISQIDIVYEKNTGEMTVSRELYVDYNKLDEGTDERPLEKTSNGNYVAGLDPEENTIYFKSLGTSEDGNLKIAYVTFKIVNHTN
jgi:hypothetical protein